MLELERTPNALTTSYVRYGKCGQVRLQSAYIHRDSGAPTPLSITLTPGPVPFLQHPDALQFSINFLM